MGLWDRVVSQFIDIIEWTEDQAAKVLVYRFPTYAKEIQMGARLTVRETQNALFINEGRVGDLFTPGLYTLSTQNMPILTTLMSWSSAFNSPFKSEIYFFNMRQFTDIKWGTQNPLTVRDPEIGAVRIRAFGNFSLRISNPKDMMKQISGTKEFTTIDDIEGQLRTTVISRFSDLFAESKISFVEAASNLAELSRKCRDLLAPDFAEFGLDITGFLVENISVPPEVEKILDKRAGMGIVGDTARYAQFQAADAIKDAAQNPGGAAGAGVGLGAGIAMGQTMAQAMTPGAAAAERADATSMSRSALGHPWPAATTACIKCRKPIPAASKFCPDCGSSQSLSCPSCNGALNQPAKFCPHCGKPLPA